MKNKHLDQDQRCIISDELRKRTSFKEIALQLQKDPTTISKEVRKHLQYEQKGSNYTAFNNCKHCFHKTCDKRDICSSCTQRHMKKCSYCGKCRNHCSDYVEYICPKLLKPPYCCNGCKERNFCRIEKRYYKGAKAQELYENTLQQSRSGVALNEKELENLDRIVSPLLKKGHSLHHILIQHKDELMISERALYNYIDYNLLHARNIDMPRKVRMSPRKKKRGILKIDKACRINRTYKDYQSFKLKYPDIAVREIDSVVGVRGGAVLLTIHFVEQKFQLAFLRKSNDSKSVTDIFNMLHQKLGDEDYKKLFPVVLGDNGSEFSNPKGIEFDQNGQQRTRVFYCDPGAAYQKGSCENNHEMIRRIIPKGKDFGQYTQEDIDLMMSHINSYGRESIGDTSPYDTMRLQYGENLLNLLNIQKISPDEIVLKPNLL